MVVESAEVIIWLGKVAAALAAIVGIPIGIYKLTKLIVLKIKNVIAFFTSLRTDMDILRRHEEENYKSTLRLVIMSEEMPIEERLDAGDTYVNTLHGNGKVKARYELLLEKYKEEVQSHEN